MASTPVRDMQTDGEDPERAPGPARRAGGRCPPPSSWIRGPRVRTSELARGSRARRVVCARPAARVAAGGCVCARGGTARRRLASERGARPARER
ncbi:UDP-GalNAc:beta-1,3-N-acetylgalactosaminyltransferase 1 isoform X3 [Muntiacus reevesi]|uniref:UDP-GalNAc:beta-1, 3-N-acetylgalactosaminyltransferase 1 isoform X3 n=1 Tax=Muntiacus reevesi TaxID=9886 RepID=UPI00330764E1